jgi:phage terminase large subunit
MMEIQIERAVFNPMYRQYLTDFTRTQIFYGGSSSGKSVFLAQRVVYDLLRGNRNYLIARQVGRTIRGSVYTEITKVITAWGLSALFTINKSDMVVTCQNGYQAVFIGLDDVEKVKSITPVKGSFTDIWIEEATETDRATVKQLIKRQRGGSENQPKRITLSFNPVLKSHWIYQEYFALIGWEDKQTQFKSGDLSILKTTYKDNRFLTDDDRRDLENESDAYFYNVYTMGNWGVLGNVIFTNWSVEDLSGMREQFTNRRHGLDFGFSGDPAAMPNTHYDRMRKTIYIYDELYARDLTNPELAGLIKPMIEDDELTADSAEPKSIRELKEHGIRVKPARKGKDSVTFGIQWLKQHKIIIDKRCINMQNEAQSYNHLWDALRYAYEDDAKPPARTASSRQG